MRYIIRCRKIRPEARNTYNAYASKYKPIHRSDDNLPNIGQEAEYSVELSEQGLAAFKSASNFISSEGVATARAFEVPEDSSVRFHRLAPYADGGKGMRVAVIDEGLGAGAKGKFKLGPSKSWTNTEAYGYTSDHGSHVSGVACPSQATLITAAALDNKGSGFMDDIAAAIYWCADQGAHVINMSLGGGGNGDALERAIRYAASKGCITFAAMGNDGVMQRQYPAACPSAQAIIAWDRNLNKMASFSNWGDWAEFAGDGVHTLSYSARGTEMRMSGTSMATPYVVRVYACLRGEFGQGRILESMRNSARVPVNVPFSQRGFGIPRASTARRYLQVSRVAAKINNWLS